MCFQTTLTRNIAPGKAAKLIRRPLRKDPTGTTAIQRRFLRDIVRRLNELNKALYALLVKDDAFGLKQQAPQYRVDSILGNTRYAFATDPQKQQFFQQWLQDQVNQGVLEVENAVAGQPWTGTHIRSTYKKASLDSYIKARPGLGKSADFTAGTQAEFLRSAFNSPIAIERVEMLAMRSYDQLKGITSQMGADLNRLFADGLAQGRNPRVVAREMEKTITGISKTRAVRLARTEIVHAYAEGQLDSFEKLGISDVGIMAEWSTAEDDRVCPQCQALEGQVMEVKEARGLIPLHPNCRCAWIPSIDDVPKGKRITNKQAQDIVEKAKRNARRGTGAAQTAVAQAIPADAVGAAQAAAKAKVFGEHAPTAALRWMGSEGWNFKQAKTAFQNMGIDVSDATIRAQLSGWKTRGKIPTFTKDQADELLRLRKPGVTPPPQPPPPPPPPPIKPPPSVKGFTDVKEIAAGRSKVYRAKLDGEDVVYKPANGAPTPAKDAAKIDYEGVDFVSREKAASTVNDELGFDLVPKSRIVDGPDGRGIVKTWVDDATVVDIEGSQAITAVDQRTESAVLDWITGNIDPGPENVLIKNGTGKIHAIDFGEAFVKNSEIDSAWFGNVWAHSMGADAAYTKTLSKGLRSKIDDFLAREEQIRARLLADGLTKNQIDDMFVRARALQNNKWDDTIKLFGDELGGKDAHKAFIKKGELTTPPPPVEPPVAVVRKAESFREQLPLNQFDQRRGIKELGKVDVEAHRVGDLLQGNDRRGATFFGGSADDVKAYQALHPNSVPEEYIAKFDNAILAGHQNDLTQAWFNKSYSELQGEFQRRYGARGADVANAAFDKKISKEAAKRGYDGIIYLNPAPPAKTEVVVIGKPTAKRVVKKVIKPTPPPPVVPPVVPPAGGGFVAPAAEEIAKLNVFKSSELLRFMGSEGWTVEEARAAMAALGRDVAEATIKAQLKGWKTRGALPRLSDERKSTVLGLRKAPKIKPKPKVKKVKPPKDTTPPPPKKTATGSPKGHTFVREEVIDDVISEEKLATTEAFKGAGPEGRTALRQSRRELKNGLSRYRVRALNAASEDVSQLRKEFLERATGAKEGTLEAANQAELAREWRRLRDKLIQDGEASGGIEAGRKAYEALAARFPGKTRQQVKEHIWNTTLSKGRIKNQRQALAEIMNPGGSKKKNIRTKLKKKTGDPRVAQKTQEAEDFLNSIIPDNSPIKGDVTSIEEKGRAFARGQEIHCSPGDDISTYVHELGHTIEHQKYDVYTKADTFKAGQLAGQDPVHFKSQVTSVYRDNEVSMGKVKGFKDGNSAAYAGKHYNGATEIISMGLEELWHDPVRFAKANPDYFDFLLNVLKGNYHK